MKKVLSAAVALGMVAGLAAGASALELKVKGKYQVDGFYFNSGNGILSGGGVGLIDFDKGNDAINQYGNRVPGNESESWYQHKFQLNPELIINDKISIKSDIRLIDSNSIWGNQDDMATDDGHNLDISKIWLVYNSPVGKWEIGRRPAGAWQHDFINSATKADRIMWKSGKLMGKNFSMYAFTQKTTEKDAYYNEVWLYSDVNGNGNWDAGENVISGDRLYTSNSDNDYYEVAGQFKNDMMRAMLAIGHKEDATAKDDHKAAGNWVAANQAWGKTPGVEKSINRVKGYGNFNFTDAIGLEVEFDYKWGEIDKTFASPTGQATTKTIDKSAWAYFFGLNMNFGALDSTLAYAHIDGETADTTESNAYDADNGTGADFEPLYILTGYWANLLNGDQGASMMGSYMRNSGVELFYITTDFKVSDALTLHGAIGYAMADVDDWGDYLDNHKSVDNDYGWEIDAGLAYKLYDNLTYEARVGWMATGDFAKLGSSNLQTEDILMLSHHLTMSF